MTTSFARGNVSGYQSAQMRIDVQAALCTQIFEATLTHDIALCMLCHTVNAPHIHLCISARRKGTYAADANRQNASPGGCFNKEEVWVHLHTPGLFVMLCPHGVCYMYGTAFMQKHESPRTLFSFRFNRFQVPPATVIYDNACHAGKYCAYREPGFFSRVGFRIDRVHQPGHCRQPI